MFIFIKCTIIIILFQPIHVYSQEYKNTKLEDKKDFRVLLPIKLDQEKLNQAVADYISEIRGTKVYAENRLNTLSKFQTTYMAVEQKLTHDDSIYDSRFSKFIKRNNKSIKVDRYGSFSEIVGTNFYGIINKNKYNNSIKNKIDPDINYQKLAHDIIERFRYSESHWDIITDSSYVSISASISLSIIKRTCDNKFKNYTYLTYDCVVFNTCKPENWNVEETNKKEFENHINNMIKSNKVIKSNNFINYFSLFFKKLF